MAQFRVAFVQGAPRFGRTEENLERGLSLAAGVEADLVVLPELWSSGYVFSSHAEVDAIAEDAARGATARALAAAARRERRHYVAGFPERYRGRYFNSALLVAPDGVRAVYRKLHLYDAFGFKESDKFHPGADIAPLVNFGDAHCGTMICYDLRFPELARMLTLDGANILFAPSGWVQGDLKVEHWQTMIKARALENGCFVIAPNQVGNIYTGHSMAVDPLGRTLVDLQEKEGLAVIDIDLAMVKEVCEKLPLLQNRRTDVYARHGR
jgi:predicted amidohydrolase